MKAENVALIFRREAVDQLRDRRTLFMIFVLPILLYPMLGIGVTSLLGAFEQKPRRVAVLGAEALPDEPRLLAPGPAQGGGRRFESALFDDPLDAERTIVELLPASPEAGRASPEAGISALRQGAVDVLVVVPPDLGAQVAAVGKPRLLVYYDRASEQSESTYGRVRELLDRWEGLIVARRLEAESKPAAYTEPLEVEAVDVAVRAGQAAGGGSVWARLLPFLLVMMALTGAFYPAIDLCAGEKERGTMETLLISPASRGEIVLGKFLTVLVASLATAILNLASMGLTMGFMAWRIAGGGAAPGGGPRELTDLQPPPLAAIAWMLVLLVPLSIFFSALCLALAVMARSMKEGQYYLTPLYMFALPLIFLTLMPGVELNAYYALVPITGVGLLLKDLMAGQYDQAWIYFVPVLMTTLAYGALALRWAVDQFQSEGVLFRESERFELGAYLRHLVRDRGPTPTTGAAVACFAIVLAATWYAQMFLMGLEPLTMMVGLHLSVFLGVPLAMTALLASSPRRTLLLRKPPWGYAALGVALALAVHPLIAELGPWIERLFPTPTAAKALLEQMAEKIPNLAAALAVLALMPAISEEVLFRGFILSGLRSGHRAVAAVVLSAVLFGLTHLAISLPSQFFPTTLIGLLLGALAVRSGSLLPGVLMHLTNNALGIALPTLAAEGGAWVGWLYRDPARGLYHPWWVALAIVATAGLTYLLARSPAAQPIGRKDDAPGFEDLGAGAMAPGEIS